MIHCESQPQVIPQAANVVCLDDVLSPYDGAFRAAVREALVWDGFEFTKGIPNLQLAREILVSIGWLSEIGHGSAWSSLRRFLEWADRQGVLVNLGFEPPLKLRRS